MQQKNPWPTQKPFSKNVKWTNMSIYKWIKLKEKNYKQRKAVDYDNNIFNDH